MSHDWEIKMNWQQLSLNFNSSHNTKLMHFEQLQIRFASIMCRCFSLCSLLQLTCYCNQVCKCETVNPAIFWQVDNMNTLVVICQSSVKTSDVRIEIQNNAGLSSFSQQGKPNNNSRLKSSTFSSFRVFKIYWRNNVLAVLVTWSIKINTYKCT